MNRKIKFASALGGLLLACAPESAPEVVKEDGSDLPLRNALAEEVTAFKEGDALFDTVFREPDGLGPLFIRQSCASCHEGAANGPGAVQKAARVQADGFTPIPDGFPYGHSLRPFLAAGAVTPVSAPEGSDIKITQRLGPPVFGRGYMEAVSDEEILRIAQLQPSLPGGVSGRVNLVERKSEANPDPRFAHPSNIGRFGFKARAASLDDFTADALQGDMGLTSALRLQELPNPDGLTDDFHPGIDLPLERVNAMASYLRLLEIPKRTSAQGSVLFEQTGCAACHVPSLQTRADFPVSALAGIDAPIYSDLLLHDMGTENADGLVEGFAESREWRTAPLMGMRFLRAFLHDGRAADVAQAILLHQGEGSEANFAVSQYQALSEADRTALIQFVESL